MKPHSLLANRLLFFSVFFFSAMAHAESRWVEVPFDSISFLSQGTAKSVQKVYRKLAAPAPGNEMVPLVQYYSVAAPQNADLQRNALVQNVLKKLLHSSDKNEKTQWRELHRGGESGEKLQMNTSKGSQNVYFYSFAHPGPNTDIHTCFALTEVNKKIHVHFAQAVKVVFPNCKEEMKDLLQSISTWEQTQPTNPKK